MSAVHHEEEFESRILGRPVFIKVQLLERDLVIIYDEVRSVEGRTDPIASLLEGSSVHQ